MNTEPATGEDFQELIKAVGTLTGMMEVLISHAARPQAGTVQQVLVPPPASGERTIWLLAMLVVVSIGATAVCLVAVTMLAGRIDDQRADLQTERLSREATDNWSAQEHTTIRGYIWTGKIEPMKPRPGQQEQVKP